MVRAGRYGEFEAAFLANGAVGMTWSELADTNLGAAPPPDRPYSDNMGDGDNN